MDICLNISSKPISKKTLANTKSNINNVKSKQNNEGSFNFKWDNSKKKVQSSFLNKKNPSGNKILPQKLLNNTKKDSTAIDNESEKVKSNAVDDGKNKLNVTPSEKFKRKVFPLFDNFSKHKTKTIDENVDKTHSTEQMFSSRGQTFKDLAIHPHISTNLERIGLSVVTTVQEKTIPVIQSGKNVFIRSQTGSGKSLSYAVPIVNRLQSIQPHINRKDGVQAVVIVPTRELVLQTYELFLKLVEPFRWIVPGKLCGGEKRSSEKARLRKGITILIGTPGRLLDHVLHTQNFKLNTVRYLVLDEADRLLDMGFQKDVNKLVQHISDVRDIDYDPIAMMKSASKPVTESVSTTNNTSERQTILLSATLTSSVQDLATFTMKDYVYIDPLNSSGKPDIHLFEEQQSKEIIMPETLKQKYIVTDVKTRLVVLSALIVGKFSEENCKMFIFMASRQMVDYHEELFKKCLVKRPKKEGTKDNNNLIDPEEESDDSDLEEEEDVLDIEFFKLHGSMEQKERVDIFKAFRAAKKGVLLCTDVAARGIDIPHADYVVQYTGPLTDDDYVHRVGRTGRAGQQGQALLFLTEPELEYVNHLKEKKLFLKREQQDHVLRNLLSFMSHISPASCQAAAEVLQKRFENALIKDNNLQKAACLAYSSWSRYYSSYPVLFKRYFDFKTAHLGHYVTSFALRKSPQEVGRIVRAAMGKTSDKNVNKKLDNHITEETKQARPVFKTKKRVRSKELLLSEFDNGLMPVKKKKKIEN